MFGIALRGRLAVWLAACLDLLAEEVEPIEADHQKGWQGAQESLESMMV